MKVLTPLETHWTPQVITKDAPFWLLSPILYEQWQLFSLQPLSILFPDLWNFILCICGPKQQRFKGTTIIFCVARSFLEPCSAMSRCSLWECPSCTVIWNVSPGRKLGQSNCPLRFSLSQGITSGTVCWQCLRTTELLFCSAFYLLIAGR